MDFTTILGWLGTLFGSSIMLPQVWKAYHTRHVRDLSLGTVIIFILNCACWALYGLRKNDVPIALTNFISLFANLSLLAMKIKWSENK